jgi:uncharacterized cupredoxin-like copper-binding protein
VKLPLALVALALLLPAACGRSPETVVIDIQHSSFRPEQLEFEPGTTVHFLVRNLDPIDHEFILGGTSVQRRHELGTEPSHGSRPGEVSVGATEQAETTFTFTEPGRVIFACHLPGHFDYGMKGWVVIG